MSFLGTRWSVEDQDTSERRAVPSRNMASNSVLATVSLSGARRRGRLVTGGPGVVLMWWTVLCRTSRWIPVGRVSAGNWARRSINGALLPMVFTLGMDVGAAWPGADRDVVPSRRRLLRQSTRRPKWARRSAPMMGIWTSATTKRQVKSRRNPKLRLREIHP